VCVRSRYVYVSRRRAVNDCNAQRSSTRYRILINNNNNAWLRIGMSGEEGWGILTSGFGPMSNNNSVRLDVILRDYFRFLLLYIMFNSPLVNSYHLLVIDIIIAYYSLPHRFLDIFRNIYVLRLSYNRMIQFAICLIINFTILIRHIHDKWY